MDSRISRAKGSASAWNPAWILEGGAGSWSRIGRTGRFCKFNELNKGSCDNPPALKIVSNRGGIIMIRVLNSKAFLPGKKSKPSFIRNSSALPEGQIQGNPNQGTIDIQFLFLHSCIEVEDFCIFTIWKQGMRGYCPKTGIGACCFAKGYWRTDCSTIRGPF